MHYGMGAGSAAVYGVLAEVAPVVTTSAMAPLLARASGYFADELASSGRGPLKPAREIPITTHVYALASHLVYGWITETVRQAIRRAL